MVIFKSLQISTLWSSLGILSLTDFSLGYGHGFLPFASLVIFYCMRGIVNKTLWIMLSSLSEGCILSGGQQVTGGSLWSYRYLILGVFLGLAYFSFKLRCLRCLGRLKCKFKTKITLTLRMWYLFLKQDLSEVLNVIRMYTKICLLWLCQNTNISSVPYDLSSIPTSVLCYTWRVLFQ